MSSHIHTCYDLDYYTMRYSQLITIFLLCCSISLVFLFYFLFFEFNVTLLSDAYSFACPEWFRNDVVLRRLLSTITPLLIQ